mmetsp:Transcript_30547/g.30213  ORF Transcript_30547/g.30213 Transcript_30547/m.30213 type:complete len:186 (+) Transcript_30547:60-617(+)
MLVQAAKDNGLSPATSRALFPNGPIEIAEILMKEWEDKLSTDVTLQQLEGKELSDQYFVMLKTRLSYEIPYMPHWGSAMKLGIYPRNVTSISDRLYSTMNLMCDIVGDHSTGIDWYAKRVGLGQVFTATELSMVYDSSKEFEQTWEFLQTQLYSTNFEGVTGLGSLYMGYGFSLLNTILPGRRRY